jgi:hypothetical protein
MTIIVSLNWQQVILIILEVLYLVGAVSSFEGWTSGGGDAGMVGFMWWASVGVVLQVAIWLFYFSLMYLTT